MGAVVGLLIFTTVQPPPRPPLPVPNGYDHFIAAGRAVVGEPGNFSDLDHDGLRELIATNAEPLRLLRLGLTRQCFVSYDPTSTNYAALLSELTIMKKLTFLLVAEGRLAEMENRLADAPSKYIDAIVLANEMSRGGTLVTRLSGIACERFGIGQLLKLTPDLNCEQTRPVISELEKVGNIGVTWDQVLKAENQFVRSQTPLYNPIWFVAAWFQTRATRKKAEAAHNKSKARLRLLTAELALRCYRFDRGRPPARLEELLPNYLTRVPSDPFSGQPLVYRAKGTNWLLYSVGVDGVGDGGKRPFPPSARKGDLFLDSP
jgi:hypothetical protein